MYELVLATSAHNRLIEKVSTQHLSEHEVYYRQEHE